MKKLYRNTLIAGLVAFGVAACGDDVQVVEPTPPPPPPLSVSMTPSNITLNVGETANLALSISGGAEGAQASWTCESSSPGVASTAVSGTGCSVTAEGAGNATVTAQVTKGAQTATAAAAVSVGVLERATVSIAQMPSSPISGEVQIVVNMDPKDETPTLLELVFVDEDGQESVVDAQVFAAGAAAAAQEAAEDEDGPALQVQQITFNVDTRQGDVDEETGLFTPLLTNGDYIVKARLFTVQSGEAAPSAEQTRSTRVVNDNDAIIQHRADLSEAAGARTAVEPNEGVRYWGGGDLVFQVIPRLFSGQTAGLVEVEVTAGAGELDATSLTSGPYLFTMEYDENFGAVEDAPGGNGHTIAVTNIRDVEGGTTGFASAPLANFHIDMTAPDINGQVGMFNSPPPVLTIPDGSGDQYFSSGGLRLSGPVTDGGVGVSAATGFSFAAIFEEDALEDPVSSIGEDVFTEAGALQWQVALNHVEDRVGNRTTAAQVEALPNEGVSEAFNVDKTAPEISSVLPESDADFVFSGRDAVFFTAIDPELADGEDPSGVNAGAVAVAFENVTADEDGSGAATDLTGGDFSFNIIAASAGVGGDGLYELTLIAPDNAIVPNRATQGLSFILDTTPPQLTLTQTPSNVATAAASSDFTIAGEITDLNGVSADLSSVEVRLPADGNPAPGTCGAFGDGPLYSDDGGAGELNRNEVGVGSEFSETFRAFNPGAGEQIFRYCIWVTGADVALGHDGNADPNIARVLTQIDITWNPDEEAPATATTMSAAAGDGAEVAPDGTVDLTALVVDQFNDPFPGHTVSFEVTTDGSGGASVAPASADTDGAGEATTTLTAGPNAGEVVVTASAAGVNDVTFTVTVTGEPDTDPEGTSVEAVSGGGQELTPSSTSDPMIVQLVDDQDNPVEEAGVDVHFAFMEGSNADGSFTGSGGTITVQTDASGQAQVTIDIGADGCADSTATTCGGTIGAALTPLAVGDAVADADATFDFTVDNSG